MIKQFDDTDRALRNVFLMIMFLLVALVASIDHDNHILRSERISGRSWTTPDISGNDAIASKTVWSVSQKLYDFDFSYNIPVPLSSRDQISDYNRKQAQDFILNRMTGYTIRPVFRELYLHLPCNKDDIPVLSQVNLS